MLPETFLDNEYVFHRQKMITVLLLSKMKNNAMITANYNLNIRIRCSCSTYHSFIYSVKNSFSDCSTSTVIFKYILY